MESRETQGGAGGWGGGGMGRQKPSQLHILWGKLLQEYTPSLQPTDSIGGGWGGRTDLGPPTLSPDAIVLRR